MPSLPSLGCILPSHEVLFPLYLVLLRFILGNHLKQERARCWSVVNCILRDTCYGFTLDDAYNGRKVIGNNSFPVLKDKSHWYLNKTPCCLRSTSISTTSLPDVKVWNTEDAEDEVLAMVVRVKLDTTMGSMLRQLIVPVSAMQAKVSFETVSCLYHLEYALTCCKCQGALFSASKQKVSFEIISSLYLLLYMHCPNAHE